MNRRQRSSKRALALTGLVLLTAGADGPPARAQDAVPAAGVPAPGSLRLLIPDALDTPASSVVLQFPLGSTVEMWVNGVPVPPTLVGRTETDHAAGLVTQTWYGVILREGANTLTARAAAGGVPGPLVTRTVQVRTSPQQMALHTLGTHVPADGRSLLTLTGRLLDAEGRVFPRDGFVTLMATGGEWVGADADPDTPGFQARVRGGQFSATLRAGLRAQTVHVRAEMGGLEAFTQAEFTTDLRPSLVTGVLNLRWGGRSTDFYRSFEDFLPPPGVSSPQWDGYASLFATGRVGDTLFTGAYNSLHALNQTFSGQNSLGRDTQTSDQQYPIYGDGSVSEALAQSRDNLSLRVERDHDYALWGDYSTQEFAAKSQQLTATTRALHALKGNYNFGALQATGFYGDNVQGFQRDTIAPDGTSGDYFLSHRPLVYGSENVLIEEEALARPGAVVAGTAPQRGVDYEIDYDRGTLLFHQPIARTDIAPDGTVLVRHIVVTYQYETGGSGTSVYGGRLQYHLTPDTDRAGLLGVTFVRQNQGLHDFDLYGADALLPLGRAGSLTAEYGHSENASEVLGRVGGAAYRVEAAGALGRRVQAGAYWRSTDTGYANDATTSFVPGQTRYGAQASAALFPNTQVRFQLDHEDNKGLAPQPSDTLEGLLDPGNVPAVGTPVDNSYQSVSVGVQQHIRRADLSVDWVGRHRTDRITPDALSGNSEQLQSQATVPLTPRLTFQARNDTTLSAGTDAVYPDATQLGLHWTARPGVSVGLNQQFFGRGQFSGHSLTSLDTVAERKFGDGGDMSERFSIGGGANGFTIQQALGLNDRWAIAPGLHLGVGYEHIMGGLLARTAAGQQYALPYAVGQSASALGFEGGDSRSLSLDYTRRPNFKASARYETRTSSGGSNTVVTAGAAGKIALPLTALFQFQQASSSNSGLEALGRSTTLRLGMAYRDPRHDQFNGLLRYEYRVNPASTPDSILLGSGTGSHDNLFAVEGVYAPQWQWEFYGKVAVRDSTSYLAQDYVGGSRVSLAQGRATYRFRDNMDLVGEARWVSQPAAGYRSTAVTVEAGYYLTADLRLAGGYTFGRVNDPDFTGNRSAAGFSFGLTAKVNELFRGFGLQKDAFGTAGK